MLSIQTHLNGIYEQYLRNLETKKQLDLHHDKFVIRNIFF